MPDKLEGWLEYWMGTNDSVVYMTADECLQYGVDVEDQPCQNPKLHLMLDSFTDAVVLCQIREQQWKQK